MEMLYRLLWKQAVDFRKILQDSQCTYVTLSRIRETIVAVEKQEVLLILSVCL